MRILVAALLMEGWAAPEALAFTAVCCLTHVNFGWLVVIESRR